MHSNSPKPFLKWVGGKRQLLPEILKRLPNQFKNYYEPFVGGGALFFELAAKGLIRKVFLSDLNEELVNAYRIVRDEPVKLIAALNRHVYAAEHYYTVRSQNPRELNPVQRAARLIYLNKTCFNGLYRVNARGEFNVPMGRYSNPTICDKDNVNACSVVLQSTDIRNAHFEAAVSSAKRGDFIYFDPPYHPVSRTANFSAYEKSGFNETDQEALRELFEKLDHKQCFVMLSNSNSPFIQKLYQKYRPELVLAKRSVNSKASARGAIHEILVRNYST